MNIEEIKAKLKEELSEHRYEHTIGVYYTALCMAMKFEADLDQVGLAALLHDCAKNLSDEEMVNLCVENNVEVSPVEMNNPDLLHQKAGMIVARDKYGVEDKDVLNAISCHTTGRLDMTLIDKIIFVADYIEPGRYKQKNLPYIRQISFTDIDFAAFLILFDTIEYLNNKGAVLHPDTQIVFEEYQYIMHMKELKRVKGIL